MQAHEELVRLLSEESLDLLEAALQLGRAFGPHAETEPYRRQIGKMAEEAVRGMDASPSHRERLQALNRYLFEERGFAGNQEDYYDPRNSFLQDVMDRKLGLPITLALLYIEVGRRIGLPLEGVGFPGHFLVRLRNGEGELFLDPFNKGLSLTREDLGARLREVAGESMDLNPKLLEPTEPRDIFRRMLYNLKGIYMTTEDFDELLRVLDLLLVLDPQSALDLRDRGLMHYELGDFLKARDDLLAYLERDPDAGDAEVIRVHLNDIESQLRMFR